jgi:hypothetical protein
MEPEAAGGMEMPIVSTTSNKARNCFEIHFT